MPFGKLSLPWGGGDEKQKVLDEEKKVVEDTNKSSSSTTTITSNNQEEEGFEVTTEQSPAEFVSSQIGNLLSSWGVQQQGEEESTDDKNVNNQNVKNIVHHQESRQRQQQQQQRNESFTTNLTSPTSSSRQTSSSSLSLSSTRQSSFQQQQQQQLSIYEESMTMLTGALVIYFFAELRDMAREGQLVTTTTKATTNTNDETKLSTTTESTTTTTNNNNTIATIQTTLQDLEPPLTIRKVVRYIHTHKDALQERAFDHEQVTTRLEALANVLKTTMEHDDTDDTDGNIHFLWKVFENLMSSNNNINDDNNNDDDGQQQQQQSNEDALIMTHFVDTNAKEELVHAIVVNTKLKRITIIFRGSVTDKDFIQDAKMSQKKIKNPVASLLEKYNINVNTDTTTKSTTTTTTTTTNNNSQENFFEQEEEDFMSDDIRIHTGFHEYLFHLNKETNETRLDTILNDVKETLKRYPGYNIYCCGHSLGGALCTLFGFYAASDDELMSLQHYYPINVYSIASPYVGNWKFRAAFQQLERMKRIRHLRIANSEDLITLMPFAVPKISILSPLASMFMGAGNLYKHVGIRLQLVNTSNNNDESNTDKTEADTNHNTKDTVKNTSESAASTGEDGNDNNNNDPIRQQQQQQSTYSFFYPKDHETSNDEEFLYEFKDAIEAGKNLANSIRYAFSRDFDRLVRYHSCEEYEIRLVQNREELTKVTLDDLYNNKQIVGNILNENYKSKRMSGGFQRVVRAIGTLATGRNNSISSMPDE